MKEKGIRRLPVVNDENHLAGIVTLDDLLVALAEALSGIAHVVSRDRKYATHEGRARK